MFAAILAFVINVVPVIPQLVTSIENLFKGQPKAGPQKWISVERAMSQSISMAASEVAKLSPAGTKPEKISLALAVFSKDVNDAFVKLANDLQLFSHGGQPPVNSLAPAASN